jgi:hypothetical protein
MPGRSTTGGADMGCSAICAIDLGDARLDGKGYIQASADNFRRSATARRVYSTLANPRRNVLYAACASFHITDYAGAFRFIQRFQLLRCGGVFAGMAAFDLLRA